MPGKYTLESLPKPKTDKITFRKVKGEKIAVHTFSWYVTEKKLNYKKTLLSKKLEAVGKSAFKERKGREIYVNVDFYSASLYYYMGIAIDLFTPIFAISRVSGWAAHVLEEQFAEAAPKPALYRPESDYVGDYCGPDTCTFTPIDNR